MDDCDTNVLGKVELSHSSELRLAEERQVSVIIHVKILSIVNLLIKLHLWVFFCGFTFLCMFLHTTFSSFCVAPLKQMPVDIAGCGSKGRGYARARQSQLSVLSMKAGDLQVRHFADIVYTPGQTNWNKHSCLFL